MKYLMLTITGCLALVALALFFRTATALTPNDVLAQYDLGSRIADIGVRAGDIYGISPDGTRSEPVCRVSLEQEFVARSEVDTAYENSMASLLPGFTEFLQTGFSLTGIWTKDTEPKDTEPKVETYKIVSEDTNGALRLTGTFTQLNGNTTHGDTTKACDCAMARYLNNRHRVCTVRSVLVPTSDPNLRAFNFASYSNQVPAKTFEACGMTKSDAATKIEWEPCPELTGHPWDVTLRKTLGVVEEVQGQQIVVRK